MKIETKFDVGQRAWLADGVEPREVEVVTPTDSYGWCRVQRLEPPHLVQYKSPKAVKVTEQDALLAIIERESKKIVKLTKAVEARRARLAQLQQQEAANG